MNPTRDRKRLQSIWRGMHCRCGNPEAANFDYYGGRGIGICPEWYSFENFYFWATSSYYDETKQLDRKDNDKDYTPENCRWVTSQENANNRSSTKFITAWGETKSMFDWTQDHRCNIDYEGLKRRLNRKWSPEEALSTAVCKRSSGVGWLRKKELQL